MRVFSLRVKIDFAGLSRHSLGHHIRSHFAPYYGAKMGLVRHVESVRLHTIANIAGL